LAHFGGKWIGGQFADLWGSESPAASSFLWLVIIATIGGLILSATKLRSYEGAGASKVGSVFIYILVATIGMKMDLKKVVEEPELILLGIIWMLIHVIILFTVAKIIKAPFFFLAVGSKANVGGAASAPIVAAAFHPSLASVGAILAVLGYAIGTIGAILCAEMMSFVAPV
ncbi:MAG: putative membrane protein, partial [Crocinitomicaceae bacterium]